MDFLRRDLCAALLIGAAILSVASHAEGAPLKVTHARLDRDTPQSGNSGRAVIKALVDTTANGIDLSAAVLTNTVVVTVDDAVQFHLNVPLTNCQQVGSGIRCRNGNVRAKVKRTAAASTYRVHLSARQLSSAVTGTLQPRGPVQATFHLSAGTDVIDVISDCMPVGDVRLGCRDRDRPNIVFVVTDDQRADTMQYMPRTLDRLAADGVTFTNAFVTTPLCAPSRASMLTGQYARHHGVYVNGGNTGGALAFVNRDASTLATWLHDSGYRTGMYGKYFTNYNRQCPPFTTGCYVPPGWDEWHVFVQQAYYNYELAENDQITSFAATAADYSTDVIAAKAIDFINEAHGQPFFLHVGFHTPHQEGGGPAEPAVRHAGTYADLPAWRPPNYDEEDVSDKPPWIAVQPRADTVFSPFFTYGLWTDYVRATQIQSLLAVDEAIDAMVAALEATGQADNTVFVFTSDNGYEWGEHRYWFGKSLPYEESIRVPLIVRYPRPQSSGRQETRMAFNIDLAPTLAELAGVAVPPTIDGVSFVPLIQNRGTAPRQDGVIEFWSNINTAIELAWAGVRTPEWMYVPYANAGAGEVELYDLVNDPDQLENRAHDPAYQQTVTDLQSRLDTLLTE